MGKKKNQNEIYRARISSLPAGLYSLLLARARAPFSTEDTNPFRTNGKPGGKYVRIAYRPDRDTKVSLGPPALIEDYLSQQTALIHSVAIGAGADRNEAPKVLRADIPQNEVHGPASDSSVDRPAPSAAAPLNLPQSLGADGCSSSGNTCLPVVPSSRRNSGYESTVSGAAANGSSFCQLVCRIWLSAFSGSFWTIPILAAAFAAVVSLLTPREIRRPVSAASAVVAAATFDLPQQTTKNASVANPAVSPSQSHPFPADLSQPSALELARLGQRGRFGVLFSGLCHAVGRAPGVRQDATGQTYYLDVLGIDRASAVLEQSLLPPSGCDDYVQVALRRFLRGNVRRVELTGTTLVLLSVGDEALQRVSVDPSYPPRRLSGFGWEQMAFSVLADRLLVRDVP